jgi:hypothetical protein
MKVMLIIRLPHETFNATVQDGTAVSKTRAILDAVQPEAVYFTEMNGLRTLIMIAELENPSRVPALAEPWFLTFNADVEFHVVMTAEDLQQADIDDLGRKWG